MDKLVIKKAVFGIIIALSLVGAYMGSTALQLAPIGIYAVLSILDWNKHNVKVWMLILSGLMFLINLSIFSVIDMVAWLVVFGLYIK
jgi:hypothetical protein